MIRCGACHSAILVEDVDWHRCPKCGYTPSPAAQYAVIMERPSMRLMSAVPGIRAALAAVSGCCVTRWTIARLHIEEARCCQPSEADSSVPPSLQAALDRCLGAVVLYDIMEGSDA